MEKIYVLVINPGSTSTKIGLFENETTLYCETLKHSAQELEKFDSITDQFDFRKRIILDFLKEKKFEINNLKAVVGRGGLLKPIKSGTYLVNEKMKEELKAGKYGEHASNLGALIADSIAKEIEGCQAFIVDPVVVDEMEPIAKISGNPLIERRSIFHALNQKAVARKVAKELEKKYEDLTLVIAHLGGGISVGLHHQGKVIDVNNALDGDGPFSPERSGGVPIGQMVELCFSGKYTKTEIKKQIKGHGGLVAYLGTNDGVEIESKIKEGNQEFKLIYDAMIYQITKEIGALSAVAGGKVDAIVITGGLANDKYLVETIDNKVSFIAPVYSYPGEAEMEALRDGALRVLKGEEEVKEYK